MPMTMRPCYDANSGKLDSCSEAVSVFHSRSAIFTLSLSLCLISLTYNTLQSSQPSYLRQFFTIQPSRSTRSSSTLTLLRPSVTSSLKFSNRSIAVAVPPPWNKLPPALRQISDPSYELPRTSPIAISPQLFHNKLKTLLFSKSYPDSSSSPYLPSRLNSKHHPP